ncbi:MAG: hypothetical protein JWQ43_3015 [Glaciihabitans sp.]|nr:hypothetical protein [Glaciihabitans sp.]
MQLGLGPYGPSFSTAETDYNVEKNVAGSYDFVDWERGSRTVRATFSAPEFAATAILVSLMAAPRRKLGLQPLRPLQPADGFTMERLPTEVQLSWPAGWASFRGGIRPAEDAILFSWHATADTADVWASNQDSMGFPLFERAEFATTARAQAWDDSMARGTDHA